MERLKCYIGLLVLLFGIWRRVYVRLSDIFDTVKRSHRTHNACVSKREWTFCVPDKHTYSVVHDYVIWYGQQCAVTGLAVYSVDSEKDMYRVRDILLRLTRGIRGKIVQIGEYRVEIVSFRLVDRSMFVYQPYVYVGDRLVNVHNLISHDTHAYDSLINTPYRYYKDRINAL